MPHILELLSVREREEPPLAFSGPRERQVAFAAPTLEKNTSQSQGEIQERTSARMLSICSNSLLTQSKTAAISQKETDYAALKNKRSRQKNPSLDSRDPQDAIAQHLKSSYFRDPSARQPMSLKN